MTNPKRQLKDLRGLSKPDPKFKKALWSKLSSSSKTAQVHFSWTRAIAIPVTIFVIVFGTSTYAYASPNITSESSLYTIKAGIEEVERRIPRSDAGRAKFEARMLERRIEEAVVLKHRMQLKGAHLERISNALDLSDAQIERIKEKPELRQKILQRTAPQREKYKQLLEETENVEPARRRHLKNRRKIRIDRLRETHPKLIKEIHEDEEIQSISNEIDETRVQLHESNLAEEEQHALRLELREEEEVLRDRVHQLAPQEPVKLKD